MELTPGVHMPMIGSIGQAEAIQHTLGSISVNPAIRDRWSGAWSFVEAKVVPVCGWISKGPNDGSRFRVEAVNSFLIRHPMKQDELSRAHNWTAKSLADYFFPNHGWAIFWPYAGHIACRINCISSRAEKLRPVICLGGEA